VTTDSHSAPRLASADAWKSYEVHALERLPLRSRWFVLLFVGAGIPYIYLTLSLKGEWGWLPAREPVAGVVVCTFILAYLQFIKRVSIRILALLRPVVPISEERYQGYARLILHADPRIELVLLVVAIIVMSTVGQNDFPNRPAGLPGGLATGFVMVYGIVALWIFLTLVYNGFRSSWALRALARSPLYVNAFDSTNLLPFGRLAALHSLASVIVVSIPLLIMGFPTGTGGRFVLTISFFSLGVLFVPLWGVHRQIVRTREQVLNTLADDLMRVQEKLLAGSEPQIEDLKAIHDEAERLTGLRKLVLAGPSWPFRDYGTVVRVVTAVFLPTLVAFLSLFIEEVIFPVLRP
jgi:hypothetical protein